jgi:hypothetical protein
VEDITMSMQQHMIAPVPCDPNNVPETFTNGPISIQGMGHTVTIAFTSIRPSDVGASMKPTTQTPQFSAVVVSRMTMPIEIAAELKKLLDRTFIDQSSAAPGTQTKQ